MELIWVFLKNLDMRYKRNTRKLWRVERKRQNSWESQELRKDMILSYLGFLLNSHFPDLVLEKLATWKHQWAQTKMPQQMAALSDKGTGRRNLEDRKLLGYVPFSGQAPPITLWHQAHFHQQRWRREPRPLPSSGYNYTPQTPPPRLVLTKRMVSRAWTLFSLVGKMTLPLRG